MDKELKEYLDRLEKNMVTKSDIADMATKINLVTARKDLKHTINETSGKLALRIDNIKEEMATRSDLKETKEELLKYLEFIDSSLQEHRHDSEVHKKITV